MGTLPRYLLDSAARSPEQLLFRSKAVDLSYAEVVRQVAAGARELDAVGIRRGEKIVCYLEDTISLALFLLSCSLRGVLPVPLSPVFSQDYLKDLTRQSGARFVYTTRRDLSRVVSLGRPILCAGVSERSLAEGGLPVVPFSHTNHPLSWEEAVADLDAAARRVTPTSSFLLQPTSGATGKPKLVIRHHAAFARYAEYVGDAVREVLGARRPRVALINELTHAFAGHMFTMGLRLGAELIVPSELDMICSLAELRAFDPDVLTMTPRILRSLASQHRSDLAMSPMFGPSARVLLSAGGTSDPNLVEPLLASGIVPIEFYGSSEASLVALTPTRGWRRGCAGHVVPDAEVRISARGEIKVRSPGVMVGYFGDDELTSLVVDDDGFFRTGDLGSLDESGYLRILGRLRDVFNTPEGSNIYPERIELQLESLDLVDQCFLVGDGRPYVVAHLVLRDGGGRTGFLEPGHNAALYDEVAALVAGINQELEAVERVVAIALYASPFDESVYRQVNVGKVRRDRTAFVSGYHDQTELLYSRDLPKDSPALVPPKERRYRRRVWRESVVG
jgi:long-chain acyl-CoA synthetase